MFLGVPCICINETDKLFSLIMFNNSGSSNEDISLTIFILYLIKCFITSELLVSIEIAISDTSRIDSTTGSSLFICSLQLD